MVVAQRHALVAGQAARAWASAGTPSCRRSYGPSRSRPRRRCRSRAVPARSSEDMSRGRCPGPSGCWARGATWPNCQLSGFHCARRPCASRPRARRRGPAPGRAVVVGEARGLPGPGGSGRRCRARHRRGRGRRSCPPTPAVGVLRIARTSSSAGCGAACRGGSARTAGRHVQRLRPPPDVPNPQAPMSSARIAARAASLRLRLRASATKWVKPAVGFSGRARLPCPPRDDPWGRVERVDPVVDRLPGPRRRGRSARLRRGQVEAEEARVAGADPERVRLAAGRGGPGCAARHCPAARPCRWRGPRGQAATVAIQRSPRRPPRRPRRSCRAAGCVGGVVLVHLEGDAVVAVQAVLGGQPDVAAPVLEDVHDRGWDSPCSRDRRSKRMGRAAPPRPGSASPRTARAARPQRFDRFILWFRSHERS